ncbi:PREDICTED: leucine-rich repeat-containing protein 74A-like [Papilio polytes]|uniref:leucine-rich repeat-containing protein 74A-like n=1 Tax=Papilio polytes TaxID=76194 RepID=UPI0006765985|nr:PREDICTED: leucine-rich repeat-containing protein 74A-like [Papilio polytes]
MSKVNKELSHMILKHDDDSSVEVPVSDWSSMINEGPGENPKYALYAKGLYRPDSGEICAKHIAMSASSILIHPYYHYPAIPDPGIKAAILEPEEKVTYTDDGQAKYLAACKDMNQYVVETFYKGLLKDKIDLKYYCVDPYGVKAMAMALRNNRNVTCIDFTDNFLNDDACFHLGEMLVTNLVMRELNLTGCRIGASGVKRLMANLPTNRSLRYLNLSKNRLGDEGVKYILDGFIRGLELPRLILRYNDLTGVAANYLNEALETYDQFTQLDLSWNKFSLIPYNTFHMLLQLSNCDNLEDLNLSWNALSGPRIGSAIKAVMSARKLKKLDISNNRFADDAIDDIADGMWTAKKLITLDVSYNPMSVNDALKFIGKMKFGKVKVQNLLMENVIVDSNFLQQLRHVKKIKKKVIVTHGDVVESTKPRDPDMREIVLNRADFLTKKQKKVQTDIALLAQQLVKDSRTKMNSKAFLEVVEASGLPLNDDLVNEIINAFPGPKSGKGRSIDVSLLVDFAKRKWPDRKLPPTPPPEIVEPVVEPEPEPPPPPKGKAAKGGKKKK